MTSVRCCHLCQESGDPKLSEVPNRYLSLPRVHEIVEGIHLWSIVSLLGPDAEESDAGSSACASPRFLLVLNSSWPFPTMRTGPVHAVPCPRSAAAFPTGGESRSCFGGRRFSALGGQVRPVSALNCWGWGAVDPADNGSATEEEK